MKKLRNVMLALALLLLAVTPVMAQGPQPTPTPVDVGTGGYVDPCGVPPLIKAKWECSDNDDPLLPGIQIIPNVSNTPGVPGETEVCVYAAVTDPNGLGDVREVWFEVIGPQGPKPGYEHVEMFQVPLAEIEGLKMCAVESEQISLAQAQEIDDEIDCGPDPCAWIWKVFWIYDTHQPAGSYEICVHAKDDFGNEALVVCNQMEVLSIVVLDVHLFNVDFGSMTPDVKKCVFGDDDFGTDPATVWNRGNDPGCLRLHFTAMVGTVHGQEITSFDARLYPDAEADFEACMWGDLPGQLLPCTPRRIDFSIYPPEPLYADTYAGTVQLELVHCP